MVVHLWSSAKKYLGLVQYVDWNLYGSLVLTLLTNHRAVRCLRRVHASGSAVSRVACVNSQSELHAVSDISRTTRGAGQHY